MRTTRKCLSIVVMGLLAMLYPPSTIRGQEEASRLRITGVLRTKSGASQGDVTVFLFPFKETKVIAPLVYEGGEFRLGCPGSKTDANGRFVIEFSPDYLRKHRTTTFALGVFRARGGADPFRSTDPGQTIITFGLDLFRRDNRTLDLSQVFKNITLDDRSFLSPVRPADNP